MRQSRSLYNPPMRLLRLSCSFVVLFATIVSAQTLPPTPAPGARSEPSSTTNPEPVHLNIEVPKTFSFVAYGDLRETPTENTKASDPVRRKALIDEITALRPAFVTISGDLVYHGNNASDWTQWDEETAEWREQKIPVLPALGNHDLYGGQPALANYFARFPDLKNSRYYSARAGNVLLLILDTSLPSVTEGPQAAWLRQQLDDIPDDVDFVFFVLHHPPYTRSKEALFGGGHHARPTEKALGTALEARQKESRAQFVVVAGHVHNYERYEYGGVMYIVSGGAGAKPYDVPRKPDDAYTDPGPTFHYCRVDVSGSKASISMVKLVDTPSGLSFEVRDSVTLNATSSRPERAPESESQVRLVRSPGQNSRRATRVPGSRYVRSSRALGPRTTNILPSRWKI